MSRCLSRVRSLHYTSLYPLTRSNLESGNMLIMTLSYTQATGDLSLIKTYVSPAPVPILIRVT